jgi:hypothetical protein
MGSTSGDRAHVAPHYADDKDWQRAFTNWMYEANRGHLLATGNVTLNVNTHETTVTDTRVCNSTFIGFMPTTANAAREWQRLRTSQTNGLFVVVHDNNTTADRTYVYSIMG